MMDKRTVFWLAILIDNMRPFHSEEWVALVQAVARTAALFVLAGPYLIELTKDLFRRKS